MSGDLEIRPKMRLSGVSLASRLLFLMLIAGSGCIEFRGTTRTNKGKIAALKGELSKSQRAVVKAHKDEDDVVEGRAIESTLRNVLGSHKSGKEVWKEINNKKAVNDVTEIIEHQGLNFEDILEDLIRRRNNGEFDNMLRDLGGKVSRQGRRRKLSSQEQGFILVETLKKRGNYSVDDHRGHNNLQIGIMDMLGKSTKPLLNKCYFQSSRVD